MIFYDLLKKYSDKEIIVELKRNYDDINTGKYLSALKELRQLEPSKEKQDVQIIVEFNKDDFDGEIYLACDGIGPDGTGEIIRWGLEYNYWDEWLAKEIHESSLNKLDELTIIVGIIWELTYNGFSQETLKKQRQKLEDRIKRIDEHPEELISHEEMLKKLGM